MAAEPGHEREHERTGDPLGERVTAVFTTYNSAEVIGQALATVPAEVRCIVVDNASRDDTCAIALAAHENVEVLRQQVNQGFGRASNIGLKQVETDYGVILNPDLFLGRDCLEASVAIADRHRHMALFGYRPQADGALGLPTNTEVTPASTIEGSYMFLRLADFRQIGFFDENFFMYFEDADLCLRTLIAGHGIGEFRDLRINHLGNGSTSPRFDSALEKSRIYGQSCAYFAAKHAARPEGAQAAHKLSRYRLKSIIKALGLRFDEARLLHVRAQGFRDFRVHGKDILFQNRFVDPR